MLGKNALIFENEKGDYKDIIACLPEGVKPSKKLLKGKTDIKKFDVEDYCLCTCDLTNTEPIANNIPLDDPKVIEDIAESINFMAKLRERFPNCPLVIITKMPIRWLRDHFDTLIRKNYTDILGIFGNDCINVYQELNTSKDQLFGVVYESEKVHIVIKPKSAKNNKDAIEQWKKDFRKYLVNKVLT